MEQDFKTSSSKCQHVTKYAVYLN